MTGKDAKNIDDKNVEKMMPTAGLKMIISGVRFGNAPGFSVN